MHPDLDHFYRKQPEPTKSCFFALREFILDHPQMTESWKYRMPFFSYNGKIFCYLWLRKDTGQPYLGIMEGRNINHPELIEEKRSRVKILLIDPDKDLPVTTINKIFKLAIPFYKK